MTAFFHVGPPATASGGSAASYSGEQRTQLFIEMVMIRGFAPDFYRSRLLELLRVMPAAAGKKQKSC